MGSREQRRSVYMPRALARLRQGFGRLMRTESDRGVVFLLDKRVLEPRQRAFLRELPLAGFDVEGGETAGARLVRGDTDEVFGAAFAHMEMLPDIQRRGLDRPFQERTVASEPARPIEGPARNGIEPREEPPQPFFPTEEPPF